MVRPGVFAGPLDDGAQRERRWLPWREAAEQVQEPDLADLIRRFGKDRSKRAWWEKLADR